MRGSEFWAGFDAHGRGRRRDDCPYPAGTSQAQNWLDGWGCDAASIMDRIATEWRVPAGSQGEQLKTVIIR